MIELATQLALLLSGQSVLPGQTMTAPVAQTAEAAAQTLSPQDIAALAVLIFFCGGFVVLGFLALRKKKRERIEILTQASLEANEQHGLEDYVSGRSVAGEGSDAADDVVQKDVVQKAGSSADAEMEAKRAQATADRASREREKLEVEAASADANDADAKEAALVAGQQREVEAAAAAASAAASAKQLKEALSKTRAGLFGRLAKAIGGKEIDEGVLEEIEEILFTSDVGARTAERLLNRVKKQLKAGDLSDANKIQAALKDEIIAIFAGGPGAGALGEGGPSNGGLSNGGKGAGFKNPELDLSGDAPRVVMVIGVNGAGKTTTIGKLAHQLQKQGHKVLLGAGDTFRAAAAEQLQIWADRNGCDLVRGKEGADPASVLFDAVEQAKTKSCDVVLCDTAGRLHTKVNLMAELEKVQRVLAKAQPGAPHEVLLVLDATVGQNAIQQARQFGEAVPLTGIILTKLDGTAKGGVVIGIAEELQIPVRYIGVGEQLADLRKFDAARFVDALFGEEGDLVPVAGVSTKGAPLAQSATS